MTRSVAELLRQPVVERVERLVGDLAAQERVGLGVDRLRVDDALEEPRRRAVDEALELGRAERRARAELREHGRVAQPRRAGRTRAARGRSRRVQPFASASASGQVGRVAVGREPRERAQPLALGRRRRRSARSARESARRRVARATSSGSKTAATSSQNGLGSRGEPSSVAASRTSTSRRVARVHAV